MRWFKLRIVAIIVALLLLLSTLFVFADVSDEIEVTINEYDTQRYRFERGNSRWEFFTNTFNAWLPVLGNPLGVVGPYQIISQNLEVLNEQEGYAFFRIIDQDPAAYFEGIDINFINIGGLPAAGSGSGESTGQNTGITPGERSAVISDQLSFGDRADFCDYYGFVDEQCVQEYALYQNGGKSTAGCTSTRCQQLDQVWMSIRGLLNGISPEAKTSVYDPVTKTWVSSAGALPTTPTTPPVGVPAPAVDLSTRPTDQGQRLLWIYNTYKDYIDLAASETNVEWSLIVAVIDVESQGDPRAVSCTGAAGLMQFIVSTAKDLGLRTTENNPVVHDIQCAGKNWETSRTCRNNNLNACDFVNDDRFNPEINIRTGARYLRQLLDQQNGNLQQALLRYSGNNPTYYNTVNERKEKIEGLMG
ncbi:MAG: transglycosylase SLT domain-containing protein [Nanoarchaeota archaeon]|nr:transglycosylase SLT domain-containing protein [Nanoarchaeota archaeon]